MSIIHTCASCQQGIDSKKKFTWHRETNSWLCKDCKPVVEREIQENKGYRKVKVQDTRSCINLDNAP